MEHNNKNVSGKSNGFSIFMYVAAAIVALIGIAQLAINIYLFKHTVSQYVAQGYASAVVFKELVPSQLLPGIFQPIAVYFGIALVLLAIGIINKKVSECLVQLNKDKVCSETVEENIAEGNTVDTESIETPEETGASEVTESPEKTETTEQTEIHE
jgi:hypothetical protein